MRNALKSNSNSHWKYGDSSAASPQATVFSDHYQSELLEVKKMQTLCPTIEVVDEHDLNAGLDRQIRDLLRFCFPDWSDIFQNYRAWHSTRPIYSVIARDEDKVIGHIAVVVRTITTTWNFRYNVASIQGVCVAPDSRHAGLAHQMLREALHEASNRGFLFAILYCKEFLVPFYTSQGWKLADDSIVMWNQRDLPISMRSNCPMYYELSDVLLPEGPLDVHSPSW